MINLSVVVPVYNEEGAIEALVQDFERELLPLVESIEVIVVDDASTDETPQILERLAHGRAWLHVHRAEQNAGHGASVLRGLGLAQGEWIFQNDSDGQCVVADFPQLWNRRHECDLALGVRVQRRDPLHRLALTRVVRMATSALAGQRIADANTPFRLLRRVAWEDLRPLIAPETLAPSILVTLGSFARGWRVIEVSVTHLPRERGTSTLRKLRLVRFSLRGLGQLLAFRYQLARAPARVRGEAPVGDSS